MGITRERRTFEQMLRIYCAAHHPAVLCADCCALLDTVAETLANCPFGDSKPLCSRCSKTCVSALDRTKIASVMRYSGPRMLCRHPALTIAHFIDLMKQEREAPGD